MNRCFAAFLALLFSSVAVSSACLAQAVDHGTLLVPYEDRDLATPAGLKALERRIDLAANRVCIDVSGPSPGGQMDLGCKAEAVANARLQIRQAIAQQQFGSAPAVAASTDALPGTLRP